ncbi:MAG TPA: orotidine-5'-phosphate decarboxylase [Salinivirgaceae bacterium]|nr:orotidine-5'-phosphate decarboxylase [Salinivirgaceae bacterium]
MNLALLVKEIERKKSLLCVGLDSDIEKIPPHLHNTDDPIFEFNKAIIDATHRFAVAFKPNIAFYEAQGIEGWKSLTKTIEYIKHHYPEIFTIADAKRGDIGNTASMYAKTFFQTLNFDALTVNPYMGYDSVAPYLEYHDKTVIILALTSNKGADDFQKELLHHGRKLYQVVIEKCLGWGNEQNIMFVVGGTQSQQIAEIRTLAPQSFFLVPGIGAQSGDLKEVCLSGLNENYGLIVNSSRQVIYASRNENFAERAAIEAQSLQQEMQKLLQQKNLID